MADLKNIIESSFIQYAGAVLQSRALVDVRDCLKPSARQIFYCLYTDKFTYDKPFKKTLKGIGSASRLHIHGDSSCLGIIMRAGQPFAMRYPLVEVEGSCGNLMSSGNWAAPRYTGSRLSEISECLFRGIKKDTIDEWRDNYDNTEQYPAVLPSIGFYNIVNGTMGIGIGAASSIPPTNLREVNRAIITLINNPDVDFDKIYCAPDFPTGGILLNAEEVKEAMEKGQGASCKIRSIMNYDQKDNCIVVTELPYSLYTDTLCKEMEAILNDEDNKLFERFNDLTGKTPLIKIYLKKGANVKKAMNFLYKNTSLESFFAINMTMLENGRFPRVFGWREALLNYISHIRTCKRREVQFDLDKALARENIVDGLIMASASIDEVVALIRASDSPAQASTALIERFGFNEEQTKAILAMKLSSLTRIDAVKLQQEKEELKQQIELLDNLLANPKLLDAELIKALQEVVDKFGDARRTKILNIAQEEDEEPAVEERNVALMVLSNNSVRMVPQDSIEGAKKGRKGKALPLPKNVRLIDTFYTTNMSSIYVITQSGKMYSYSLSNLVENEDFSLYELGIDANDGIVKVFSATNIDYSKYLCFFTKGGMIKKTATEEYRSFARKGIQALKLKENDSVVECLLLTNDEGELLTFSSAGNVVRFKHSDIAPVGRLAQGVKGMKLGENEYLVDALYVDDEKNYKGVLTISSSGKGKITSISEFVSSARTTKGVVAIKMETNETLNMAALVSTDATTISLLTGTNAVSLSVSEVPVQQRNTQGIKLINLSGTTDKIKLLGR